MPQNWKLSSYTKVVYMIVTYSTKKNIKIEKKNNRKRQNNWKFKVFLPVWSVVSYWPLLSTTIYWWITYDTKEKQSWCQLHLRPIHGCMQKTNLDCVFFLLYLFCIGFEPLLGTLLRRLSFSPTGGFAFFVSMLVWKSLIAWLDSFILNRERPSTLYLLLKKARRSNRTKATDKYLFIADFSSYSSLGILKAL